MRKSVALTLLGAVLVLSGVFYFRPRNGTVKPPGLVEAQKDIVSVTEPASAVAVSAGTVASNDVANRPSRVVQKTAQGEEDRLAAKAEQLMDLAASDSPSALQAIVSELNNADPEIRKAAVDATVQLGNTNAIPWLEAAAQWSQSADERSDILEAVDFLKLPKLENRTEGKRVPRPKTVSNTVKTPKL